MSTIDVKLETIYWAAHHVLPIQAGHLSRQAQGISDAIGPLAHEIALAGNHPIAGDLSDLAVELFAHLREMARTISDSAIALDAIADDFVAVDTEAAAWLDRHKAYLGAPELPADPTSPEV